MDVLSKCKSGLCKMMVRYAWAVFGTDSYVEAMLEPMSMEPASV